MKIAFVVDKAKPFYVGGYEGKVWNLARRLARVPGNEVRVYTSLHCARLRVEGVLYVRLASPDFSPPSTTGRSLTHGLIFGLNLLRSPFQEWSPDVLVVESIPYFHLWTMSSWASKLSAMRILLIDEVWETYSYFAGPLSRVSGRVIHSCLRAGLGFVDVAVSTSSVTQRTLLRVFGSGREVQVIPDGVDEGWRAVSDGGPAPDKMYDFINVGRLVRIKRQTDFLEALARLRADIHWEGRAAIVGFGPLEADLRRSIQRLELGDRVDLLTGVKDEVLHRLLTQSKVFVLCSEREGFSRSTLEAVASGLPVIVARPSQPEVFGVSDFVRDGENGLFYAVGRIDELEELMKSLLQRPDLRAKLSMRSVETRAQYGWDVIADKFSGLIERDSSVRPAGTNHRSPLADGPQRER